MAWHPIRRAVQCPVCTTWVQDALTCSWCTVELGSGSWRQSDPPLAARTLRRLPKSPHEGCHVPNRREDPTVGVAA